MKTSSDAAFPAPAVFLFLPSVRTHKHTHTLYTRWRFRENYNRTNGTSDQNAFCLLRGGFLFGEWCDDGWQPNCHRAAARWNVKKPLRRERPLRANEVKLPPETVRAKTRFQFVSRKERVNCVCLCSNSCDSVRLNDCCSVWSVAGNADLHKKVSKTADLFLFP